MLTSWKGANRVGDLVALENVFISNGDCSKSIGNKPKWMVFERDDGVEYEPPAERFSEWLIYATGPEPWALSKCDRSLPRWLSQATRDIEFLDSLRQPPADKKKKPRPPAF